MGGFRLHGTVFCLVSDVATNPSYWRRNAFTSGLFFLILPLLKYDHVIQICSHDFHAIHYNRLQQYTPVRDRVVGQYERNTKTHLSALI